MTAAPSQLPLDLSLRPNMTRANFVTGDGNRAALALIDLWPDWPDGLLALYGPEGSGKSHLATIWATVSHAINVTPDNIQSVLQDLQDDQAFLIEADDPAAFDETSLFHLYNHVRLSSRASLLIASRLAPARWPVALADLRSRLSSLTAAELQAPDEDLLRAVMEKLFRDRQLQVDDKVMDYILLRMERSFAALQAIVGGLDAEALRGQRAITIPLAKSLLDGEQP